MISNNHSWNVTPQEAIAIQKELRHKVVIQSFGDLTKIRYIAGADVSMNLYSTAVYAGFVLLAYPTLEVVAHVVVKDTTEFPYIPGLLSFREIPALIKAWDIVKKEYSKYLPDIIVVDGVGIAHPRRLGIASHLGVLLDMPTVGCAKSLLTGVYEEPDVAAGSVAYIYDRFNPKEIIGATLRTKSGSGKPIRPVFISPGHKMNLADSLVLIKSCTRKHRLPEPTRLAHEVVNQYRKEDSGCFRYTHMAD